MGSSKVYEEKDLEKFDTERYFETFYKKPEDSDYFCRKLNDFWIQVEKTGGAKTMLEYGAGPTISRFIPAAKYVESIIASEFLEGNRKAMQDWIANEPNAFDWRPAFEYVVTKIEGMPAEEVDKRVAKVRDIVKAVIPCDVKAPNPMEIPTDISEKYGPPFDVIATCLTIETVVESEKEYKDQISYLVKMIRPGGYLFMHGVIGQTFYSFDGIEKFFSWPLKKDLILEAMKDAGLKNIVMDLATNDFGEERKDLPFNHISDATNFYFVYGQK